MAEVFDGLAKKGLQLAPKIFFTKGYDDYDDVAIKDFNLIHLVKNFAFWTKRTVNVQNQDVGNPVALEVGFRMQNHATSA